jgi:hypothetical protein
LRIKEQETRLTLHEHDDGDDDDDDDDYGDDDEHFSHTYFNFPSVGTVYNRRQRWAVQT